MARITNIDRRNADAKANNATVMKCKMCNKYYNTSLLEDFNGYNCVCKICIDSMTDIFELSESDLEDIITNAGRHLAEGIEQ